MVIVRMFSADELGYFDTLSSRTEDPFNFFGFRIAGGPELRRRWAEHGLISGDRGTLAVDLDGQVIGDVEWHAVNYGPPPMSTAYNIGIRLNPEYRGHGHGTAAQRSLAQYLFATYPVNRIEAGTDIENIAEQRALEKAGFLREAVLRGAQWRDGQWHDLVLYACVRADVEGRSPR